MSTIDVTLRRLDDQMTLKIVLSLDYENYDLATIAFVCGKRNLDVFSVSNGRLQNGKIEVGSQHRNVEVFTEYPTEENNIECLIGYYRKKVLVHYDNLSTVFDNQKTVQKSTVKINELHTVPGSFDKRLDDFLLRIKEIKSEWKAIMICNKDIIVNFVSTGSKPSMLSFGESSEEVLVSDYIFPVDPQVKKLHIPIEIFKDRYDKYNLHANLGIYELIKPDFVGISDLYYKIPISSSLRLDGFIKTS